MPRVFGSRKLSSVDRRRHHTRRRLAEAAALPLMTRQHVGARLAPAPFAITTGASAIGVGHRGEGAGSAPARGRIDGVVARRIDAGSRTTSFQRCA